MTAVEFLIAIIEKNVNAESIPKWENWKKVVKDMEKQQIVDAHIDGQEFDVYFTEKQRAENSELYYKQTFEEGGTDDRS